MNTMFHVKQFTGLLSIFLCLNQAQLKGQGSISMSDKIINYNLPEDAGLRKVISATQGFNTLSKDEQEVVYYMDYARKNPSIFLDRAINAFLNGHPEVKSSYTKSLQKLFEGLAPLQLIYVDTTIGHISEAHAKDLQVHNVISHTSTNGTSFKDRMSGVLKGCGSEAIHASPRFTALEAVLMLLFDFNVPDLGHRKSLLNINFTKAGFGVASGNHGNTILVIDFSCQ